jgi:probable F420-dependent oxidoreductase
VKIGISLHALRLGPDAAALLDVAREVERRGFDAVYVPGHVLDDPNGSAMDPMTVLSAVAGATQTIRLISSVLVLPHYNPVLLANEAATLDALSRGRFRMGVGVGWDEREFEALGVPFSERGARADEALQVMRLLWTQTDVSFHGRFTSLDEVTLGSRPLTPGGPPIWVGGLSDAALRRALRFSEAWHGTGASPAEIAALVGRLEAIAEQQESQQHLDITTVNLVMPPVGVHNGFEFGHPLGGRQPTPESIVEELAAIEASGVSAVNLLLPLTPDTFIDGLSWLEMEVLPRVGPKEQ